MLILSIGATVHPTLVTLIAPLHDGRLLFIQLLAKVIYKYATSFAMLLFVLQHVLLCVLPSARMLVLLLVLTGITVHHTAGMEW